MEVLDLVGTGSSSQDAADAELQEALRQSLAEEQARKAAALVGVGRWFGEEVHCVSWDSDGPL